MSRACKAPRARHFARTAWFGTCGAGAIVFSNTASNHLGRRPRGSGSPECPFAALDSRLRGNVGEWPRLKRSVARSMHAEGRDRTHYR